MDPFAYWIFGYQKFCEPIIRRCICLKKGWHDVTAEVKTPAICELDKDLKGRLDWTGEFSALSQAADKALSKRKRRIVLDAAFLDGSNVVIAEFKSWGGFQTFIPDNLYQRLARGQLFPDRLSIQHVRYQGERRDVARFVIATNLQPSSMSTVSWQIGQSVVEVFDIPGLLREHGEQAAKDLGTFTQLDEAVERVKRYVTTGG